MRYTIYFIFNLLFFFGMAHPVHITITNIEPNASNTYFDVAIKIFTDDLEHGIAQQLNKNIGLIAKNPCKDIHKLFLSYINNNFKIIINNKPIEISKIKFVKYSIVDDATWLYFKYKIPSKIKKITIYNNLLNHLYPDMTNLVIIKWNQQEQGLMFSKNKTEQVVI
ncbi:MAG: DUF6702 family protein [Bacteroidales bacterium]